MIYMDWLSPILTRKKYFSVPQAGVHFADKLRSVLPTSGPPFACPCCKHEGKHFFNLSVHFLTKHNLLDSWIKKALDAMEDEAIAKAEDNEAKGLLPDGSTRDASKREFVSSGEEEDDSEVDEKPLVADNSAFTSFLAGQIGDEVVFKPASSGKRRKSKRLKTSLGVYQHLLQADQEKEHGEEDPSFNPKSFR